MKNNFTAILLSAIACLVSLANAAPAEAQPTKLASPKSSATQTQSQPAKNKFDLTFDDLKFEMEKGSPFNRKLLTPKINGYHNSTVKLRGYIRPSFTQSGLSKFIFVRDNKECCFGLVLQFLTAC